VLKKAPTVAAMSAAFVLAASLAAAQTKLNRTAVGTAELHSVLWVGNSFFYYNNSMHSHVAALVRAANPASKFGGVSITISGSGIDWHDMQSYFRPGGIGKYSFVGDNEIEFRPQGPQFDTVIVMDCSQCPIHPKLQSVFHEFAKKQSQIIRSNGAQPVFFMSWAYKDKPEMTAQLAEQYTIAANDNDALVIPAGLAFAAARAKRPELELYQPDKRHPTLAGTYLAACVVYATLFGKSPVGLSYTAGLVPDTAAFLQTVAWEAVQEYLKK